MSSSASRRIFRAAEAEDDVFVVGETVRRHVAAEDPVTTVASLLDGARKRSEHLVTSAQAEAEALVQSARSEAEAIREAARAAGYEAGREEGRTAVESEAAGYVDLLRAAANEGRAVRDAMFDEAMPAIARAVAMACRRVVGVAFESDPSLTADACADAVRAAAGQQIISIRVNPAAVEAVRAALVDLEAYVRPDSAVELGGCLVDLKDGSIDATLETRLSLMELALRAAGGGE
jgi:flagellar biosynthesis/type III secretory pathway protein FliH